LASLAGCCSGPANNQNKVWAHITEGAPDPCPSVTAWEGEEGTCDLHHLESIGDARWHAMRCCPNRARYGNCGGRSPACPEDGAAACGIRRSARGLCGIRRPGVVQVVEVVVGLGRVGKGAVLSYVFSGSIGLVMGWFD
jgi:hypothetical protein